MKTAISSDVLFSIAVVFLFAVNVFAQKADLVFKNGVVYTVDERLPKAQAVAVADGKILAVGSDAEIQRLADNETQVIDLQGKTMVPGFIDSHYHFIGVGQREYYLNLDGVKLLEEFLEKVNTDVAKKAKDEWIVGRGWMEEDWPTKEFPTRYVLDNVAPQNPAILRRADGHAAVVNSLALKIASIDKSTADPQGGKILRDANGEATGMLIDKAMNLVTQHVPSDSTPAMIRKYSQKAEQVALRYGITEVHDMGSTWPIADVWKEMYKNDELKIRLYTYIRGPGEDADRLLNEGPQIGLFDHRFTVRGIKITADGALGSRGAALLEPYSDAETSGLLIYKDEQIYPTIKRALANGIQMAVHAIGDQANRTVLDLFERAMKEVPPEKQSHTPPRFRIEHAQIVHWNDLSRFAKLGVIPSMQPSHAIGDLHFAVRRLGLERMTEAYAWRTFIDSGCIIPGGSDAPVEEGNPLIEFYAAVVRKDTTGFSAEGWHPELKMTREEALKSLTIWGAHAAFEEEMKGSIVPGKFADLVVLDRDLMTEPEERLFDIKVLMTVIGGEVVFQRESQITGK